MDQLVSVIVTTRNNHATLDACLASIKAQTYPHIELIVVDNNSTDDTKEIARRYATHVSNHGPERSVQRNIGVKQAKGTFLLIVDSDMELGRGVVRACVAAIAKNPTSRAVIIPEESFGQGFWARCKQLERSFYIGQDTIEAARFFERDFFKQLGGYSEEMTGGEDWDLTRRARKHTTIERIDQFILHNEGRLYFGKTIRKFYYYAQRAEEYFAKNPTASALTDQSGPLARYRLFLSRPGKLFKRPHVGFGMLALKTAEYAGAGAGLVKVKLTKRKANTAA